MMDKKFGLITTFCCVSAALAMAMVAATHGQVPPQFQPTAGQVEIETPAEVEALERATFQPAALETFVDGVVAVYRDRLNIAGATVAVVHGGEVALLKGYGFATEERAPVDPERTLFRIGSISKTFLWTAIMQLVEEGRITLDDPVNDHLPESLRLPDAGYDEPVRIHHLMSHNAGFEDSALGHLFAGTPDQVRPLATYLAEERPARVRPPGRLISYSNYSSGLAGALVAAVSGMDFEDYVEQRIYGPLGMTWATFREPLGEDALARGLPAPAASELAAQMSSGFRYEDGTWKAGDPEFITQIGPAGAMYASADAMSRYMLAHLAYGRLEGNAILDEDTARAMRETLSTNAAGVNGIAHGFIEYDLPGGLRGFGHAGGTLYFLSNMVMAPELDLGVFVSANTAGSIELGMRLPGLIVEQFFTGPDAPRAPAEAFADEGGKYAGSYRATRRSYTTLEKIASLGNVIKVSVTDDGYLRTTSGGETQRWIPLGNHLFRHAERPSIIGFGEDNNGDIDRYFDPYGVMPAERIGFFAGAEWFGIIAGLMVLAAFGSLAGAWLRRKRRISQSRGEALAGRLMPVYGAAWLVFFGLFGAAVVNMAGDPGKALFDFPAPLLRAALAVGLFAATFTALALISLYPVLVSGNWPAWRRIRHTLVVLIGVAFVLTLNWWNVIGFKF